MKIITLLFAIVMSTQTSLFAQKTNIREGAFGLLMMEALKQDDPAALLNLFPTVEDLHALMDVHVDLYSTNLEDAKIDLSTTYETTVLVTAHAAFRDMLLEGRERGFDWRAIRSMEVMSVDNSSPAGRIHLRFYSNEIYFDLEVQKFTTADGQLKITQFIKLI